MFLEDLKKGEGLTYCFIFSGIFDRFHSISEETNALEHVTSNCSLKYDVRNTVYSLIFASVIKFLPCVVSN